MGLLEVEFERELAEPALIVGAAIIPYAPLGSDNKWEYITRRVRI